jgi:trehalose utilization protein
MSKPLNVLIWNEFIQEERGDEGVIELYPDGIHHAIAAALGSDFSIRFALLKEPEHGLTEEVLESTDVLVWWSHIANDQVQDDIVTRVHQRVLEGMGLIVLHSAHKSKPFLKLTGASSRMKFRADNEKERVWVVAPNHPIAEGLGDYFELEQEEMYGEPFDIPQPDELVFISWFQGGEVFRSGCCYQRGLGKVFYFRPGHEKNPTFYSPQVKLVLRNAVRWAASHNRPAITYGKAEPLEPVTW